MWGERQGVGQRGLSEALSLRPSIALAGSAFLDEQLSVGVGSYAIDPFLWQEVKVPIDATSSENLAFKRLDRYH